MVAITLIIIVLIKLSQLALWTNNLNNGRTNILHRGITAALLLLFTSVLIFISCDVTSEKEFEGALAQYTDLKSITEGPNASIVVNRESTMNMDSYFTFNVESNSRSGLVREGTNETWCLEWNKPIAQNGDLHEGIEFYSKFGSENWKPANYLLNIKDKLKK